MNWCMYSYFHCYLKSLLWEMCNFICYPGTHTQIMTMKYIWWNQWLFNMRKNVLHFCTYSPCQVAGRLMYHFLLLQWQSISISGKSVTSKGAIEKIINKKHSMIYCNRVVENCEHFQSFTDQRLNDWYHLASNYRAVDSA